MQITYSKNSANLVTFVPATLSATGRREELAPDKASSFVWFSVIVISSFLIYRVRQTPE
jgi:hypothetical protein